MRERLESVNGTGACNLLPALAKARENWHVLAEDVLQVDFGSCVFLVADDDGRAGDVLKTSVFHPEFLSAIFADCNRGWNILELGANDREPALLGLDGCFALT